MTPEIEKNLSLIKDHKIYFGHQSVGTNILEGLSDLLSISKQEKIKIVNLHHSTSLPGAYLAHSYIGKNTDANSKCIDFSETIRKYFSTDLEYALLKFCFVDIRRENDAKEIFELYKNTIDSLKSYYPKITFIHVTVPLTSHNVNFKLKVRRGIKKILGKRDYSPLDNIKRNEYNQLLRDYYKNEPVFDIAKIEGTYADGREEVFVYDGKAYQSLIFDYTYDAGHLNKIGRQHAALELISILAEVIKNKSLMRK